jgi:hypothetical protein
MLVVLGKNKHSTTHPNGNKERLWKCQCDCGNIVDLRKSSFVHNQQKSCGCLGKNRKGKVDNKRRPEDKTGQRFGLLIAIKMIPDIREENASVWQCQCDCGNIVNFNAKRLNKGIRLNCGGSKHEFGLVYPPTPSPYPKEASQIVQKYLGAATAKFRTSNIDSEIEDERMNRLIRAAWIITEIKGFKAPSF